MIPLKVDARGSRRVLVTWLFGTMCIAVLLRLVTVPAPVATDLMYRLAVVPSRLWTHGLLSEEALTVFTSTFLHAGWIHLVGNMWFLAVFGPSVESRLGWFRTALLMVVAGSTGAVVFAAMHPHSGVPLVGASGAIAGLLGAQLVIAPRARVTSMVPALISIEVATLPVVFVVGLWFATQVVSQVASVASATGNVEVAWIAHIAGFATGTLLAAAWKLTGGVASGGRRLR